jgi:hypothetical protein
MVKNAVGASMRGVVEGLFRALPGRGSVAALGARGRRRPGPIAMLAYMERMGSQLTSMTAELAKQRQLIEENRRVN